MYKLVALDLDGTLLNSDKQVSEKNRRAIAAAREQGVSVVLASGRPLQGMLETLETLGLTGENDYVVCYNGSYVYRVSDKKEIRSQIMTGKDAKRIAQLGQQLGVHLHAFSLEHGLITPENNQYTGHEAHINGLAIHELDFSELSDEHAIIKTMFADAPERLDAITAAIPTEFQQDYTVVRSAHIFLEFLNKQSNKGIAIQAVAEHLGIAPDEVIAMGDAQNDHHMIQYAGLGVAMANATEDTKAIADLVTDSHDESGVAQVIDAYILSQETPQ